MWLFIVLAFVSRNDNSQHKKGDKEFRFSLKKYFFLSQYFIFKLRLFFHLAINYEKLCCHATLIHPLTRCWKILNLSHVCMYVWTLLLYKPRKISPIFMEIKMKKKSPLSATRKKNVVNGEIKKLCTNDKLVEGRETKGIFFLISSSWHYLSLPCETQTVVFSFQKLACLLTKDEGEIVELWGESIKKE